MRRRVPMPARAVLAMLLLAPVVAFAQEPAAVLDPAPFAYAASLHAMPSADGVSRLRLPAAVHAVAREDLADLRVVDAASRQWPYILVPAGGSEVVDLRFSPVPVARPSTREDPVRSRWHLVPAVAPLELDGITLRIDRATFDRGFRIAAELPGLDPEHTSLLASSQLQRAAGAPAEVSVTFPQNRVTALVLTVDDGDEAPLPIVAARASSPVADLLLVAPAGEYTLLAGDEGARPPRYEITGARDRVLAAHAGEATLGPLAPSPRHVARRSAGAAGMERVALWAALGVAVWVLGALTLRLSRRAGGGPRA